MTMMRMSVIAALASMGSMLCTQRVSVMDDVRPQPRNFPSHGIYRNPFITAENEERNARRSKRKSARLSRKRNRH